MAMPQSMLVSPATLNLAEDYVVANSLDARPVKGLDAPLEVFELDAAGTVRWRLQAGAARGLSASSDARASSSSSATRWTRRARGAVSSLQWSGSRGVAKSRLLWELV